MIFPRTSTRSASSRTASMTSACRLSRDGSCYAQTLLQARSRRYIIDILLKLGVTRDAANAELQPLLEQFAQSTPKQFPEHFRVQVEGLNDWVVKTIGGTLYLLFGAVGLLLAIGCGNVSIL